MFALSADDGEGARRMVEDEALTFPVGYGLDASAMRDRYGMFIEEERGFLHATGYLLRPSGVLSLGVYSTGALGRLTAREVVGTVQRARDEDG